MLLNVPSSHYYIMYILLLPVPSLQSISSMKSSLALGLVSRALAATIPRGADVFGGTEADIKNVPYQAEFNVVEAGVFCGGSIISKRHILTAGHCSRLADNPSEIVIRAGSAKLPAGTEHAVASIHQHPKFNTANGHIDYDVSILELASGLEFSDSVKAIAVVDSPAVANSTGLLSSWGDSQDGDVTQPMEVDLAVIALDECIKLLAKYGIVPSDRFFCTLYRAGGKAACHGDSGGPIVIDGKLAGSVSGGPDTYVCPRR
ncbi:hypothetical protein VHEMI00909 [[Torrubiella] hemipterigena]|uniref:Peptidase S1 domain-containing protein n=1 Tax=[Torrubiella] hemipterigena TaxID=1531966 RepID=A0A0A1SKK3_9HYPO|nr:hypothetical protein VHEMI00909 [[Torrubiella] hemipterigena]